MSTESIPTLPADVLSEFPKFGNLPAEVQLNILINVPYSEHLISRLSLVDHGVKAMVSNPKFLTALAQAQFSPCLKLLRHPITQKQLNDINYPFQLIDRKTSAHHIAALSSLLKGTDILISHLKKINKSDQEQEYWRKILSLFFGLFCLSTQSLGSLSSKFKIPVSSESRGLSGGQMRQLVFLIQAMPVAFPASTRVPKILTGVISSLLFMEGTLFFGQVTVANDILARPASLLRETGTPDTFAEFFCESVEFADIFVARRGMQVDAIQEPQGFFAQIDRYVAADFVQEISALRFDGQLFQGDFAPLLQDLQEVERIAGELQGIAERVRNMKDEDINLMLCCATYGDEEV